MLQQNAEFQTSVGSFSLDEWTEESLQVAET